MASDLSMKNLDLAYFSAFAPDSVLSNTSTDVNSDPYSAMNALTSLCVPIKSSLMVHEKIRDVYNAIFGVPAKRQGQEPILFGRNECEPIAYESSGGNSESPQFFHYGQSHVT